MSKPPDILRRPTLVVVAVPMLFLALALFAAPTQQADKADLIRQELRLLEERMKQTEAGQQNVIQQLQDIDRTIELRRRLIGELEAQSARGGRRVKQLKSGIKDQETQIAGLSRRLSADEKSLRELQNIVGKRMAQMYRQLSGAQVSFLFNATSLNDLSQRQHYLQAIARYDHVQLDLLRTRRDGVVRDRTAREDMRHKLSTEQTEEMRELDRTNRLIAERRREEASLQDERATKDKLRRKAASDTDLLRALIEERRQSLAEIGREITKLVETVPAPVWQADMPFNKLAGRLPWPLKHQKIVQSFGSVTDPKLGTTIINPGVDLQAQPGDPVRAVAKGEVTKIAWLRGFGNTLILSHGDGYYTVYARLGAIMTSEGAVVNPGQVIAEVGDSGADSAFHFEIWEKREKHNPLKWLAR